MEDATEVQEEYESAFELLDELIGLTRGDAVPVE